jgi:uncharacterized protein DUF5666
VPLQKITGEEPMRKFHPLDVLLAFFLSFCASFIAGCGQTTNQPGPQPGQTTQVVILLSSTANDSIWNFYIEIASVALSDSAGTSVPVYNPPVPVSLIPTTGEFIHVNGGFEPLVTATVPQGTYTSAALRVAGCRFSTAGVGANGGPLQSTYNEGLCSQGTGAATVTLPSPITISGSVTVLSLNLQAPQSYTLAPSTGSTPATYTISPVFTLTPIQVPAGQSSGATAMAKGIVAQIQTISGTTLGLHTANFSMLIVNTNPSTLYWGVSGFSSLSPGMNVNFDAAIQSDGSLLATRIEVDDLTAAWVTSGPALYSYQTGEFYVLPQQGPSPSPTNGGVFQSSSSTAYRVSAQIAHLQDPPFAASFNAQSLFAGQNVAVSFSANSLTGDEPAETVTLIPQTIQGMISALSTDGGYTVYEVKLADDDPITVLQRVAGAFPLISDPTHIVVYADINTQMPASGGGSVGSTQRFRGLLFYDNGTLRMDCSSILAAAI